MNILHYSLGLPPYRSGGLTKYTIDLIEEQINQGENVSLLFPGKIKLVNSKVNIKKYKNYKKIKVYELINPLPVPLLNGVCNIEKYTKKCDKQLFKCFLKERNIEVIHVHTFMGLYKEFLDAAKSLNIKILYTTHDYFGLCPKVNFLDLKGNVCLERCNEKCSKCNITSYNINTIKILQSGIYRFAKNQGLILKFKKFLRKYKKVNKVNIEKNDKEVDLNFEIKNYNKLFNYYNDMFNKIDFFLFNSNVTKHMYERFLDVKGKVISITHKDIVDKRIIRKYNTKKLKLCYLGPYKEYKGFNLMLDMMKSFENEGILDITLDCYGDEYKKDGLGPNIILNGKYSYKDLSTIFNKVDLVIVPSLWYETFGFIVLEAISFGVPVMVTEKVGSKDIIKSEFWNRGFVVKEDEVKQKVLEIFNDKNILKEINKNIVKSNFNYDISNHCKEIKNYY